MRIGVTYTGVITKHHNYVNWLKGGEQSIEIVTLSAELNNLYEVDFCDGIVLSGGVDIAPEFYNGNTAYAHAPEKYNRPRDAFEKEIFLKAQQNKIPILGICRGMQLINCIYGGTLLQDIGEKNKAHKAVQLVDRVHEITIDTESILYNIIGNTTAVVNSAHHQVIGHLGDGLKITAWSHDGLPEAMEPVQQEGASFLLCVQWHPERMYHYQLENTPATKGIRQKFLSEIK